jgi:hypothetical protein
MLAWLTQQDVEDYGHDVLDLAQRAALHATAPELQRINDQNESLRRQLAEERRRGLYQALDAQIPDWRQIDNDPRWRQWLLLPYEMSGRPRQMHLNDAIAAADAHRVLSFFRGFLREAGQSSHGQQPQQQAPSAMPTGRTYTRSDIVRFSDDYRRGRIPEDVYRKLEADIVAAGREGRIVGIGPPKGKAPYG